MLASAVLMLFLADESTLGRIRPAGGPEVQELIECREKANATERLACFDKQSAAVDEALRSRVLTVVDTREIDRGQRRAFGLASPDRAVLSRIAGHTTPYPVKQDGVIRSVAAFSYGRYTMTLADGAVWRNTDLFETAPAVGSAVHIDKTPFGGYLLKVPGAISVHAARIK